MAKSILSIISFIVGFLAILIPLILLIIRPAIGLRVWLYVIGIIILAIISIIFGIMGLSSKKGRGFAIFGIIFDVISIILTISLFFVQWPQSSILPFS